MLKRGIIAAAAVVAVLAPGIAFAPHAAAAGFSATVKPSGAVVREGPASSYRKVGNRPAGSSVGLECFRINSSGNRWYKEVNNGGLAYARGWVYSGQLKNITKGIPRCKG